MTHASFPVRTLRNKTTKTSYALAIWLLVIASPALVRAQTFSVIHAFSGRDGTYPFAGLTQDRAGNFYGTTAFGGNTACQQGAGCGTVYKLSRAGSGWVLSTLYIFAGASDGWEPNARVLFGPDGALYGTTEYGGIQPGTSDGYGTVFRLAPPANACGSVSCPWTKTTLYRFTGGSDGANPGPGDLNFDAAGTVYGTTQGGGLVNSSCFLGSQGCGVVFALSPSSGGWTEKVIYGFTGGDDGDTPESGIVFDRQGNAYGTASNGGQYLYGTVYELIRSGSEWTESTLHGFAGLNDGAFPAAGLISDAAGNFYGTTSAGSPQLNSDGVAYELTPSSGGWLFTALYEFPLPSNPMASLTLHNGDLYGSTTSGGSYGFGSVFELMPGSGGWTASTLYSFMAQNDGDSPFSNVAVDAGGNVFGTTITGGQYSDGVVFEITP